MVTLTVNWSNTFTVVGFGFATVLIILTLLVYLLMLFEKVARFTAPAEKSVEKVSEKVVAAKQQSGLSPEVVVAIAAALDSYTNDEVHDHEAGVLTIKKTERNYSPWNASKYN